MTIQECCTWLQSYQEPFQYSKFFQPTTELQISKFEKENHIEIPPSYRDFLKLSNGARILDEIELFGIHNPKKNNVGYPTFFVKEDGKIVTQDQDTALYASYQKHSPYLIIGEGMGFACIGVHKEHKNFVMLDYEKKEPEGIVFNEFGAILEYWIELALA